MRAIQFDRLGGPEVLELREVPRPDLKPGTVIVRNEVIAVNFGDLFFLRGEYLVKPAFPDIPGMEAAGVIEATAPDVADLEPGTRVAYIGMGAFAEYTRIRRSRVIPLPDDMDFEQAAAFPIAVLTAWHLLHTCHRTSAGQWVLVHSAAGGVGIAAVQIAKAAGARVIGTVSTNEKVEMVLRFGANHAVEYAARDFAEEALRLTDGRGVDLILDAVGKPTVEKGLGCLAPFGHLVVYGSAGGAADPIDPMRLFGKCLKVSGFVVPMVYGMREIHRRGLDAVFRLAREGKLTVPVGARFTLAEAAAALRFLASRRSTGKLLLIP
ncbi:MAG TPA: quinone oxidoreductase [Candidatus Binatia bacterium]|nr:quinone oxidoreductase [Candidatus Binatia bacterium]